MSEIFGFLSVSTLITLGFIVFLLMSFVKVINEYERAVIFRFGRIIGAKGPGLIVLVPLIDRMIRVDMRTVTMDVPPQDVITKDNVTIKVNAVVYFRVVDPNRAINEVENFLMATSKLAQTTLRSIMGQSDLDFLLMSREEINHKLQAILDGQTEPWGVKVTNVEVKQMDLPVEMQRAMAKQAEAERERRAKVIAADGEFQASTKLGEAAAILAANPSSMQLRYLQTMAEMSHERTSQVIFPIPIDIFKLFMK